MDLSTMLGILGILLTVVFGVLPFVVRKETPHKNNIVLNNNNVINSINQDSFNTEVHYDNKTIINHYYNNGESKNKATTSEDDFGSIIMYLVIGVFALSIIITTYIRYQQYILICLTLLTIIGSIASVILTFSYGLRLTNRNKFLMVIGWMPIFLLLLLIKHPLIVPSGLDVVLNSLLNPGRDGVVSKFLELLSTHKNEITFISLQIMGLIPLPVLFFINAQFIFRNWKGDIRVNDYNNYILAYLFLFIMSFLLISGILMKIITLFSSL